MDALKEKQYALNIITAFLNGEGDSWDFDDWISSKSNYQEIQDIKYFISDISYQFPSNEKGRFCNDEGIERISTFVESLKRDTGL